MRRTASPSYAGFVWATLLVTLAGGGFLSMRPYLTPGPTTGSLRIVSDPPGASVELEGRLRGLTPLTLTLPPGPYNLSVSHGGRSQDIAATVTAGSDDVHHVRWAARIPPPELAVATLIKGRLQIISDPAGAMVTVDGVPRGMAPLMLDEIDPGEHRVVAQHMGRTQRRSVVVQSGATAALMIANPAAGTESGWLSARSNAPLQVLEDGRLIGSTETDRIPLATGTHTLEFVAAPLGFRARRTITIAAGETATAMVSLPQAPLALDAVPWAEAWIDGTSLGHTPIAGLMQPIGTHQIEFRHPELGMKQATVTVSLAQPARVVVDMRASAPVSAAAAASGTGAEVSTAAPAALTDVLSPQGARPAAAPAIFVPAVTIRQDVPAYVLLSGAPARKLSGTVRVGIGPDGRVTSAAMVTPIDPRYDARVVTAARKWLYKPALRAGTPIESEKLVSIHVGAK